MQTAEGALNEVQDMLQRMNELAVKAANGTNSEDDRNYIQDEVNQLIKEIDRVSTTTKFNETYLLKGDDTVKFTAQGTNLKTAAGTAGADGKQTYTLTIEPKSFKTEGGKSDVTFSLMGKNFSVRLEETDDNKTLATKLAKAMNENKITDSNVGAFTASADDAGKITLTAAEKGKVADTTVIKDGAKLTAEGTGVLTLDLHVGADSTSDNQISVDIKQMSATVLGLKTGNSTTGDATGDLDTLLVNGKDDKNARAAIDTIASALQEVSKQRSALGAAQNRLEHTISNLDNVVENTTSAESSIRDTDMATEMVKYSNNNILAQAGQAMLAQANQSNQGVLSLLQ